MREPRPQAEDTSLDAERLQIGIWRRMSPTEKGEMVARASRALLELQLQGLRRRHPDANERQLRRLALAERHGEELARRVYGEV